ncbi:MAG: hypothetical protein ABI120_08960 [Gemmatimonadaceae bacterium]
MSYGDDETGIVCRVTPDGDVICDRVVQSTTPREAMMHVADALPDTSSNFEERFVNSLPAGDWGPNKTELARRILGVLGNCDMPDARIPRRSGEIVDSVKQLLTPVPPSILLYNYSQLPANVMGAYFLNKADLVRMQEMFQIFQNPKQP